MKEKEMRNTMFGKAQSFGMMLNKNASRITVCMLVAAMMCSTVFASGADGLWTTISGLVQTWVTRLGGVVMFIGAIMFGLGWKSDDAEQKLPKNQNRCRNAGLQKQQSHVLPKIRFLMLLIMKKVFLKLHRTNFQKCTV